MRQIVINELKSDDLKVIREYLSKNMEAGPLVDIYWLPVPVDLLADAQQGHEECGPFVFGIELGDDFVSFELLVRSKDNLHCPCTSYADADQRQFLLGAFDEMIVATGIRV